MFKSNKQEISDQYGFDLIEYTDWFIEAIDNLTSRIVIINNDNK